MMGVDLTSKALASSDWSILESKFEFKFSSVIHINYSRIMTIKHTARGWSYES